MRKTSCEIFFNNASGIKEKVDNWLKKNPTFEIVAATQSQSGDSSFITLTVFYTHL